MIDELLKSVFWVSIALAGYTYFGFFALLAVLARLFRRPLDPDDGHEPTVALLISAYNEEDVIAAKLENALAQDYPRGKLRVYLVSDGSDDDTLPIARRYEERGVTVMDFPDRRGKNHALNTAIPETEGEILLFSDANAIFARDAVRLLVRNFSDPSVGCVVGRERRSDPEAKNELPDGLYWRYEDQLKKMQSALRSVLVANGPIFAMRRSSFRTLHNDVANDFQSPMDVGAQGLDIVYEPAAVSYERSASDYQDEFRRKVRIVTRGLVGTAKCFRQIRGFRLFLFVSHKFLRWFVGFFLTAALAANLLLLDQGPLYGVVLALQLLFYLAALAGWWLQSRPRVPKLLDVAFYFCLVNFAAMVATMHFVRGRSFSTWDKAASVREAHTGNHGAAAPEKRDELR